MGRKIFTFEETDGDIVLSPTSGVINVTSSNGCDVLSLTPTGACTINIDAANTGNTLWMKIMTSGTTSRTITFGTNFKTPGTLSTGTVNGKMFLLEFVGLNNLWYQVIRTGAL